MFTFKYCNVFVTLIMIGCAMASPMFYKKNGNDKYEPDLIAVSSTVIPLAEYENSTAKNGTQPIAMSEEYKIAYIKHIHKKAHAEDEDPDTLITYKKKYHHEKKATKSDENASVIEHRADDQ